MPLVVPTTPQPQQLRGVEVGKPVSGSAHATRWDNELAFLRGYALQPVYAGRIPRTSSSGNAVHVAWQRSPGCDVLAVAIELWDSSSGDKVTVSVKLNGAPLSPIGTGSDSRLDGAQQLFCAPASRRTYETVASFFDVSAVATNAVQDLAISWTSVTGGAGIATIAVREVPLADANPALAPTTEVAASVANFLSPNPINDGTAAGASGLVRLWDQLDQARYTSRVHRQICTTETTACALSAGTTGFTAFTWPGVAGGFDPKFSARCRALYDVATANTVLLWIRYLAVSGGTFQITFNGSTKQIACGASASFATASAAFSLPTNTTNLEYLGNITFQGKTANVANPFLVSTILLLDHED